jgi:hypothetical protein
MYNFYAKKNCNKDAMKMKNKLKQLFTYINKVYEIGKKINSLKDNRTKKPKIENSTITIIVLLGFMTQIRSINRIRYDLDRGNYKKIFSKNTKMPKIDAVIDQLKDFDIDGLKDMQKSVIKTVIKNKVFKGGTIDGYKTTGIDGTELYESTKKHCDKCLTREIENKEGKKITHYFHRAVAISTIGSDPRIVYGYEMLEPKTDGSDKDEGEITGGKRLIKRLYEEYGDFADVIVGDALYCKSTWIKEVLAIGMDAVVRVKDERLKMVKKSKELFEKAEATKEWIIEGNTKDKYTIVKSWEEAEMEMTNLEMKIRFVKYLLEIHDNDKVEFRVIQIITTNKEMTVETLLKMIQKRWDIENCIFHQLKTEWHMDHCYIHGGNAVETMLLFMILAFNLMQLYFFRCIRGFRKKKMLQIDIVTDVKNGLLLWEKGMSNPLLNIG